MERPIESRIARYIEGGASHAQEESMMLAHAIPGIPDRTVVIARHPSFIHPPGCGEPETRSAR